MELTTLAHLAAHDLEGLMAETFDSSIRQVADRFARSIAGDDQSLYVRIFVSAFNLAWETSHQTDGAPQPADYAIEHTTRTAEYAMRARGSTGLDALEGPSIYDDSTYLENARYVINDTSRIINGVRTDEYPDCVAVGSEERFCCTGTLISPTAVLTAGHCVPECSDRIFLGTSTTDGGRTVHVSEVLVHPDYHSTFINDDLALLLLSEDVEDVPPRPIASSVAAEEAGFVRLVGFGNTDIAGLTGYGERRRVDVPVASPSPSFGARPETEFVAGAPFLDLDSCRGDSGGPAYVEVDGVWLLAGATSRATSSSRRPCGDGGIYTRVGSYVDWVEAMIP